MITINLQNGTQKNNDDPGTFVKSYCGKNDWPFYLDTVYIELTDCPE